MQKITPTSKLIVFDLDDCLAQTIDILGHYLTQQIMDIYKISYQEADVLRIYGMENFGCSAGYLAERDGYDQAWIEDIYAHMGEMLVQNIHEHLEPCALLQSRFANLQANSWTIALLTQGRKDYAHGILRHLEIEAFFHSGLIMGRDCVNYTSKRTEEPYKRLLERLNAVPDTMVMLDDTPANLKPAQELGFKVGLVGTKSTPTPDNMARLADLKLKPNFLAENINDALKTLCQAHAA